MDDFTLHIGIYNMVGKLHKNKTLDLGICEIEQIKSFTPHNISKEYQKVIFEGVPESVKNLAREILADGWSIYAVNQQRGRCYYASKTITIPVWAIKDKRVGYKVWYICHELAHAWTKNDGHGQQFMERLIETCPIESVKYELGYQPRSAKKAGIHLLDLGL